MVLAELILESFSMMQFLKHTSIIIGLIMGLVGCATEIQNVQDAPVNTLSGKELSLDQTTKAIVLAGMGLKWKMDVVAPGHIVGTLNLRNHQAIVDITYSTKVYSIMYKSSRHLLQVDENGNPVGIHPNYNGWIENLDNAIRTQFIAIDS